MNKTINERAEGPPPCLAEVIRVFHGQADARASGLCARLDGAAAWAAVDPTAQERRQPLS